MMNVTRQRAKYTSRYFYNHDIIYLYTTAIYYDSFQKRLLSDGFTLSRVVKFASQVLFSMWQHQELREVYRKSGGFSGTWPGLRYSAFLRRVEGGGLCDEDSGRSKRETKLSDSSQLDSQQAYGQPGRHKVINKP